MPAEAQKTVRIQQLIPTSTVLLEKLTASEPVEKFPEYCET